MQVNPYLTFNGQCEAAFKFYEEVLGGKIAFITTYGETPAAEHMPAEAKNLIIHATLMVGDQVLMGSDAPPGRYDEPKGIHVSIGLKDTAEGERIFKALAENATVVMPFEPTFWAAGFGMCVDRFGIPWMVNCEKEQ